MISTFNCVLWCKHDVRSLLSANLCVSNTVPVCANLTSCTVPGAQDQQQNTVHPAQQLPDCEQTLACGWERSASARVVRGAAKSGTAGCCCSGMVFDGNIVTLT